jgi:drug/metabolite transporter (DMT)-like permease
LTPVFSLIAGAMWLGEPVSAELLGALVVVGLGITLVNWPKPKSLS